MKGHMQNSKRGQMISIEGLVGLLVIAAIMLIVGAYVVYTIGAAFTPSGSTNTLLNNTVGNVTNMFAQVAPLLVIVGIVGFVVIILAFVSLLRSQNQGRTA